MKELFSWIKKYKIQIILFLCVVICLIGWIKTMQSNKTNQKIAHNNIEALTDSVSYYKGKNGELIATKLLLECNFEQLKSINAELEEKIKNMNLNNPQQVIYITTEVEHNVHDTVWEMHPDSTFEKRFDFSNQWRVLNGKISFSDSTLGLTIDEDKVFLNYYLAIQNNRVYLTSDNPYVTFNEIQGLTIPREKNKNFTIGIGPSITLAYDFTAHKTVFVPGISLGIYWGFIHF